MARKPQSLTVSNSFEYTIDLPADARLVVGTKDDLYAAESYPFSYIGMIVATQDDGKAYILKAKPSTDPANWAEVGADIDTSVLEGEVAKKAEGYIETNTETVAAGTDRPLVEGEIVKIKSGDGTKEYQGVVDANGVATIDVEGEPVTVENDATNGLTIAAGTADVDATEAEITTETIHKIDSRLLPKGAAADTMDYLEEALTVKEDQGKYKKGDIIPKDTPIFEIVRNMLSKTNNPSVQEPSLSLTGTGAKLLESGSSISATLTATFNRGAVSPAFGGVAYRAGEATAYSLNGGGEQAENTFSVTVDESNREFTATVKYAAGEEIKNDEGGKFMDALEAGSVTSSTLKYDFVDALYSNEADINVVAKLALVAKSAGQKTFSFPAATIANPEEFHIPSSWNIIGIDVENELSGKFELATSEFTITDTVHPNAANTDVAYKKVQDGRGVNSGPRRVRVRWS